TVIAARALSAISGTLLILTSFLIAREFFKSKKVALISALMVAVSPWAIFYSQGAFEGNLALLAFSVGIYLWLRFTNTDEKKYFFFSLAFFVFSMYSYQAPRFVAPLFVGISIVSQKFWWKKWRLWISGFFLALALSLPQLFLITSPAGYHRAIGVSLFSRGETPPGYSSQLGDWQKLYLAPREFLSLYLHYFSPSNLFWQNDYNPQRRVEGYSVFYLWQLPLLLIGVWAFFKKKIKDAKYFLFWLALAPIPAALTADPFHTYRAILLFLPLTLLTALGFGQLLSLISKMKNLVILVSLVGILYSVFAYLFGLLELTPITRWRDWDYGYKEVSQFIKDQPSTLRVVIDDPNTESYIHLLFNQVIPISEYQEVASFKVGGEYYKNPDVLRPEKVGRFEFRSVDWPTERGDKETLFVFPSNRLYPSEFSGDPKLNLEKTVYSPSGEPAFYIIKTISKNSQ
ncbi:MAG: hypothetical protein UX03_C0042G0001, partial [Candidatus Woesebacteria bacterium GW2011_GWE1_45_18]